MTAPFTSSEVAKRFGTIAQQFCAIIDFAPKTDRSALLLLLRLYVILPKLIDEAINLPDVELGNDESPTDGSTNMSGGIKLHQEQWTQLYNSLKEKLGDWDEYRQVFDPTQDVEAVVGSLADDFADIYQDLRKGLALYENGGKHPEHAIWVWRVLFHSHWGAHAMDVLRTIHFRLQNSVA